MRFYLEPVEETSGDVNAHTGRVVGSTATPCRGGELMILVAGGTGTLGTQLVRRLSDRGQTVRVLTRDPTRRRTCPTPSRP